jgi:Flp pilus assembly protein TadB
VCGNEQTLVSGRTNIVGIHEREFRPLPPVTGGKISGLRKKERNMLGIIAAVLVILWLLGFFAFHVTSGFIHIVLVVAVIMLILHFVRGRS